MIHLVIDGYNLLGVRGGLRGDIEARREALIRELVGYRQRKGYPLTVVFDGWRSGHPVEHGEWREGIEVIFSRQGETADTVIKRLARVGKAAGVHPTATWPGTRRDKPDQITLRVREAATQSVRDRARESRRL